MYLVGTNACGAQKMKQLHIKDEIWIAIRIERGFPEEIQAFFTENAALKQERIWRKRINLDYDETGVLSLKLSEINTSAKERKDY